MAFSLYLIVPQEVAGLEGEEQRHVIVQRVLAVDIVRLVLQQPACLVHHPVWRVNRNHHLSKVIFNVHRNVQLGLLNVCHVITVIVILS